MTHTIELWTIQHASLADALRRGESLQRVPSVEHVLQEHGHQAVPAYWWMWHEVRRRTRCEWFPGVFWAWKSPPSIVVGVSPHMQILPAPGEALIRFTAPSDQVVLSRFSLWENTLVCAPILTDEEESTMPDDPADLSLEVIMSTWHKIFDLDFNWPYGIPRSQDPIQATLAEIRPEWIIDISEHP